MSQRSGYIRLTGVINAASVQIVQYYLNSSQYTQHRHQQLFPQFHNSSASVHCTGAAVTWPQTIVPLHLFTLYTPAPSPAQLGG